MTTKTKTEARDHIDRFLESIRERLPMLDPEVEGIVDRIQGLHRRFRREMDETLAEFELDWVAQKLTLRGGVRLFRGQGWVVADGADIDLAGAHITMTNVRASLPVGAALKK